VHFKPSVRVVTFAGAVSIALVVAVSISALAPMRATAGERFAYRSEAGRFSIDLPEQSPLVRELTGSRFSVTDNDALYTVFAEGAEFEVEIHDIPRVAEFLLTSHYILERSAKGMLEDIGAREVDSAEISIQGAAGARGRVRNTRWRVYGQIVVGPGGTPALPGERAASAVDRSA